MERVRKPFQGVSNIIRFNWHFYFFSTAIILLIFVVANTFFSGFSVYLYFVCVLAILSILASLVVSYYVYDLSELYKLDWLDSSELGKGDRVVNINAGFDETSMLLKEKFVNAEVTALDFYEPAKHTEISIKRARKAYPPFPNTRQITTSNLYLSQSSANRIFLFLSAHEIRNHQERTDFFRELERVLKPSGQIFLTEHLRNLPNFLAYNIGAFHFHSEKTWLDNISKANLRVTEKTNITPFITTFILEKNETSS